MIPAKKLKCSHSATKPLNPIHHPRCLLQASALCVADPKKRPLLRACKDGRTSMGFRASEFRAAADYGLRTLMGLFQVT